VMGEKRGKLLVIEDHKELRSALKKVLNSLNYEVTTAEDGPEGLKKAREIKPDLIFCDLNLTGIPCLDILKTLKQESPQTKVIITGTATTCEDGYKLGACYCLSNPISLLDLLNALKECLGHSFPE